jgi:hypothetical protein
MYPCNFHAYTERTSTITIKQVHQYFRVALKPMSSLTISLNRIVINSADTKYIHIVLAKNPVQSADRYMSNTLGSTSKHLAADSRRDDEARRIKALDLDSLDFLSTSLKGGLSVDVTLPSIGFVVNVSPSIMLDLEELNESNFGAWFDEEGLDRSVSDLLFSITTNINICYL